MALKAKVAYTNTDYEELRDALIAKIPLITDRWTDFNESDIGIALLETFCGVGAMLNYMLDRRLNEVYLPTMRERKHGIYFAESVGYKFNSRVAARTMLRFSIPRTITANVIIPKYTRCSSPAVSPIPLVTVEDAIIPAGQLSVDIEAWQGSVIDPSLTFNTGIDPPPYVLSDTEIAEGSIVVKVNGRNWVNVDNFINYSSESEIYTTQLNPDDTTTVFFGDGFEGKEPDGTVEIIYILTDGPDGNRGAGTVTSILDTIFDSSGETVNISVTNPSELAGGNYRESLYHAKKQIPAEVQANSRAITRLDIRALVEGYPGIKQCKVLDINDYPLYSFEISYYEIRIAVIPDNEGYPGQALKEAVYNYLVNQKKYVTADLEILDPEYVVTDITVNCVKYRDYEDYEVIQSVTEAIQEFFRVAESPAEEERLTGSVDGLVFGQDIEFEQLVAALVNLSQVSTLDSLVMTANGIDYGTGQTVSDVPIEDTEIALIGNVLITVTGEV